MRLIGHEGYTPFASRHALHSRLHALEWLHKLAPLDPVLRGPLAEARADDFDALSGLDNDVFADCIEIDVEGDAIALVHLLSCLGYHVEPLAGDVFMIGGALTPIEIRLRKQAASSEPQCDAATLDRRLRSWLPLAYKGLLP